jgi:DNA polymerase III epsilon subunit-like protein
MSYIMVDVEADGPIPGDYSMISLGAVLIDDKNDRTFYGQIKPISEKYQPEALKISGFTREETMKFDEPENVMNKFKNWINETSEGTPLFISDNNGFDWMFICWYFHHFISENPFGFSSSNLGSLYKGVVRNMHRNFKHLRRTKHTHNPVDDARGNAQAFLEIIKQYDLKI